MTSSDDSTFWREAPAREAAAIIDAEDYFRAFHAAAQQAKRCIVIVGWQFDMDARLLRGEEATRSNRPTRAWDLLRSLCEDRPDLFVYVLLWDYSFVYVLEREWLIGARAALAGHPRLQVQWRQHPDARGSHHQKYVIIDDRLAFVGGMDLAETRWDRRSHDLADPLRCNSMGFARPPMHDVQAAVTGPVVGLLLEAFHEVWTETAGGAPRLPDPSGAADERGRESLASLVATPTVPLPAERVGLARTHPPYSSRGGATEVQRTYERLIAGARRLIYLETQYFTSTAIRDALRQRLRNVGQPRLVLIAMLPDAAESGKERLVLGTQQQRVLADVVEASERHGHEVRLLSSGARPEGGGDVVTTYVHSKLMIVDDRVVTIGSANLTNRSMGFDSELDYTFHAADPADVRIGNLRCSLLAEHAGISDPERFADVGALARQLDELVERDDSRLRLAPRWDPGESDDELLSAAFDPCVEVEPEGPRDSQLRRESLDDESDPPTSSSSPWQRAVRAVREVL